MPSKEEDKRKMDDKKARVYIINSIFENL